jgi:phosphatidylserine/phosphatidylglycerophosphate/cardiolipin synthase-like enzyme
LYGEIFDGTLTPLRALLQTVSLAKHFIHFTSFGISDFFIGALKLAAQRISVRGIVSNVDSERVLDELTAFNNEVPYGRFEIKHFLREGPWHEAPHQKLIVIDGFVAFKGSANLTLNGWRKATRGLDHVEVVTNVNEVIDLHNRLFSPVWASFSKVGASIRIS